jgi:mannitol/fructose-specific phosphotransferase system IIA component (Ntr-type)
MITIPDALSAEHIELDLAAANAEEAIAHVAGLLRHDARVLDWSAFYQAVRHQVPCRLAEAGDFSICLPHARTSAVAELSMSAGRVAGILPFPGARFPVRYIFCIGAPKALAGDYLRVVGALMRIFSDPHAEALLRTATTKQEFLEVLGAGEMKL